MRDANLEAECRGNERVSHNSAASSKWMKNFTPRIPKMFRQLGTRVVTIFGFGFRILSKWRMSLRVLATRKRNRVRTLIGWNHRMNTTRPQLPAPITVLFLLWTVDPCRVFTFHRTFQMFTGRLSDNEATSEINSSDEFSPTKQATFRSPHAVFTFYWPRNQYLCCWERAGSCQSVRQFINKLFFSSLKS